jgi:hypothetical protein
MFSFSCGVFLRPDNKSADEILTVRFYRAICTVSRCVYAAQDGVYIENEQATMYTDESMKNSLELDS